MSEITISKTEYQQLRRQSKSYQMLVAGFFESIAKDPIVQVVEDFRQTDLYTDEFLKSLESGLRESSYSKKYGDKTN